ncbi:MAG: tetratricopeptide repeat protein [Rubrivivax sp.]|nr:tetratricopeptide repeat protein [Rubrivivax sp.]
MPTETVQALLFTDVVDSTAMVQRLGPEAAATVWAEHDRHARALMSRHGGREIDRSDGFLLLFDDATSAARFADGYHRALAAMGLTARVGLHVGRVSLRRNEADAIARGAKPLEVDGLAKPVAARLMALAPGGRTLLSAAAREALHDVPPGQALTAHGHYRLKGVDDPLGVHEIGPAVGPRDPPPDNDKAYRVVRVDEDWMPVREVRHNLAPERDAFVGRARELRELGDRLAGGQRLLTVLGSGGTGKTRLVRRYARAWLGEWPGGVTFCDLSDARDVGGICAAAASALGVSLGRDDPVAQIGHVLERRGRNLVILDNFEQVAADAAATLGLWADRAFDATFVVTSRERLHLAGEQTLLLDPLPMDGDAIDLFAVRARAQRAGFELDPCRHDVARIVQLLDGLPLAIELAAARVRILSPAQILQRLSDRFVLLAGARGATARQTTLRAAIDWSWELLAPWEQSALAQCSVFDGGFTLAAAEAVLDLAPWADAPTALDVVQALVDKSLLRTWHPGGGRVDIAEPFFGMYMSIHQYASQRLAQAGPGAVRSAEAAHGRHYAELGTDACVDTLFGHGGIERRRARELELPNVRAACERAAARGDAEAAVLAWVAAWQVLEQRGPYALAHRLGVAVSALSGLTDAQQARASLTLGTVCWRMGLLEESQRALDCAMEAAVRTGDGRRIAAAYGQLGALRRVQGRYREGLELIAEALARFRALRLPGRVAWALGAVANLQMDLGDLEQARTHFEQALALEREHGDRAMAAVDTANLGSVLLQVGRYAEARELLEEGVKLLRDSGNLRELALAHNALGNIGVDTGRYADAETHFDVALRCARDVGVRQYEAILLGNKANSVDAVGRPDEAKVLHEAALALQRDIGAVRSVGLTLGNLAELAIRQGRLDEAEAQLDEAMAIHVAQGNRKFEGYAWWHRAELALRRSLIDDACRCADAATLALNEASDAINLARLRCLRGRIACAGRDPAAAREHLQAAETAARELGAGDTSPLGQDLAALRQALAASGAPDA